MATQEPTSAQRYILISVHDVTPFYDHQLDIIFRELYTRTLFDINLFVTPLWHGKYSILGDTSFLSSMKRLKKRGAELVLHGFQHDGYEFMKGTPMTRAKQLDMALSLFIESFGFRPAGFIPPMWMQKNDVPQALDTRGFKYTEAFFRLTYFHGSTIRGIPFCMESPVVSGIAKYDFLVPFVLKNVNRLYGLFIMNHANIVRFSLHPREADTGNLGAALSLLDRFLAQGYLPVTHIQLGSIVSQRS